MRVFAAILLFSSAFSLAQTSHDKLAEKALAYYENFDYRMAAETYSQLDTSKISVLRPLSLSWWKIGDLGNAQRGFAKIVEMEGHTHDDIFSYVRLLRQVEYYGEAEKQMDRYTEMQPKSDITLDYAKNKGRSDRLKMADTTYFVMPMNMNSKHQEFGVSYYKSSVVFVSSRENTEPIRRRYNVSQLPFLDLYTANIYDSNFVAIAPFPDGINSKFHEGPAAFTAAGDLMIFSRNDLKPNASGHYYSHLYSSRNDGSGWTTPQQLAFDTTACSSVHQSISADGKWLYFSSTMAGGDGGSDIWKVEIMADGGFGSPMNLGTSVNTEGNESWPFIHPENNLFFFSSDSRYGLGGMDVFVAQVQKEKISGARNLGAPVNSSSDDFSFVLSADKKSGFISSDRKGGRGSDDIYFVDMRSGFPEK